MVASLDLRPGYGEVLVFSQTGGRYSLIAYRCPSNKRQNVFEHNKACSPGYFMLVSGADDTSICMWPGTHRLVNYSIKKRCKGRLAGVGRNDSLLIPICRSLISATCWRHMERPLRPAVLHLCDMGRLRF